MTTVLEQLIKAGGNSYGIRTIAGFLLTIEDCNEIGNYDNSPILQAMEVMKVIKKVDHKASDGRTKLWELQQLLKMFDAKLT
jgi:hypothetical protein